MDTADGGFGLFVLVVQLVAAGGILAFWRSAKHWKFDEPWRPPGFTEHERSFRLPDTVAAVLLAVSALLVWADRPEGRPLALVASGMLLFLGIIDASYMWQQGLFARDRDGRMHAAIVSAVLGVAVLLLVRYLPSR